MLALTFALIRRFGQYSRNQAAHRWKAMGNIISVEGSTTAILGLGDIGGSYARKMKALGAYTIGFRRSLGEKPDYLDEQYTLSSLDEVLPRADIIAIALPGLVETRHLIGSHQFSLMKEGAYLINVGRGNIVDPDALKEALTAGRLGGAGLDVTEPEPLPARDPLWDFDNVIITPHVAGHFFLQETFERIVRIAGENLKAYVTGSSYSHVVNRSLGY
jgi:phosphoglycerate dehydrogenase-like enzyme